MNILGQGFQILEHYRLTDRQTNRQTDTHTGATQNITTPHSWVVKTQKILKLTGAVLGRQNTSSEQLTTKYLFIYLFIQFMAANDLR